MKEKRRPTIKLVGEIGRQSAGQGGGRKHKGFVPIAALAEAVIKDVIRKRR